MLRLLLLPLCCFTVCCSQPIKEKNIESTTDSIDTQQKITTPMKNGADIQHRAREAVIMLQAKNYKYLAERIHPTEGLLFSPYGTIDKKTNKKFTGEEFASVDTTKKYTWGNYDGSGDVIALTIGDYFDKFVNDVDFIGLNIKISEVNKTSGKENTLNNIEEIFPGCEYIEYFVPGTKPEMEGMDWKALRLVFKKENEYYFLVAVIHDQWTI